MAVNWTEQQLADLYAGRTPLPAKALGVSRKRGEMNKTETRYAQWLEIQRAAGLILSWRFEPKKFELAPRTTYTPDFIVQLADYSETCDEVKPRAWGKNSPFARDDAKVKLKVAAALFPEYTWRMCWPEKNGEWHVKVI